MIQKSPSLPRGWNEGLNMMKVVSMFDMRLSITSCQTMQQKRRKKIENRSTYRAFVQISVRF